MGVLILVGIAIAVTVALVLRRADAPSAGPGFLRSDDPRGSSLPADLDRWVEAGLIDGNQAAAITAFEEQKRGEAVPRRVSLVTEALAYAGSALAVGAAAAGLGPNWEDLPTGIELAVVAGATGLLILGGWLLHEQQEAAFVRLRSVLWFLAVGAAAGTAAVVAVEVLEIDADTSWRPLLIAGSTALVALVLWLAMPAGLQLGALYAASAATLVTALILVAPDDSGAWPFAVAIWGWGLIWVLLGWRRLVTPAVVAAALGAVTALAAPLFVGAGEGWLLGLGLATAAAAVAISIPTHTTALLAGGTVAMFGYVIALAVEYFEDSVGMPVALGAAGVLILVLAVGAGRLSRRT